MKIANPYRGALPFESEFSHRFACWANNHRGWAKMKKYNKRLAKRRINQELKIAMRRLKEEWHDA